MPYVVPSELHLGPSWGHLWSLLGSLVAILGPSWAILGPPWVLLVLLGATLGPSWRFLGALRATSEPSWANVCSCCANLVTFGPLLELSGRLPGAFWSHLRTILGSSGGYRGGFLCYCGLIVAQLTASRRTGTKGQKHQGAKAPRRRRHQGAKHTKALKGTKAQTRQSAKHRHAKHQGAKALMHPGCPSTSTSTSPPSGLGGNREALTIRPPISDG